MSTKLSGNNLTDAILRKVTDYGDARAQLAQAWRLDDIRSLVAEQTRILGDIGSMLTSRGVPSPDLEARLDAAFATGELDHRPVPAERIVMTYRDREGDYWDRRPNGRFHLRYHNGDPSKGHTGLGVAEAELTDPGDAYAPMTAVAWAQNAESAVSTLAEPAHTITIGAPESGLSAYLEQTASDRPPLDGEEPFAGPSPDLVAEVAAEDAAVCGWVYDTELLANVACVRPRGHEGAHCDIEIAEDEDDDEPLIPAMRLDELEQICQDARDAAVVPAAPAAISDEPRGLADIDAMEISLDAKYALKLAFMLNRLKKKPSETLNRSITRHSVYRRTRTHDADGFITGFDTTGRNISVEFNSDTEQWSVIFR